MDFLFFIFLFLVHSLVCINGNQFIRQILDLIFSVLQFSLDILDVSCQLAYCGVLRRTAKRNRLCFRKQAIQQSNTEYTLFVISFCIVFIRPVAMDLSRFTCSSSDLTENSMVCVVDDVVVVPCKALTYVPNKLFEKLI
jgi:hypothetical protein